MRLLLKNLNWRTIARVVPVALLLLTACSHGNEPEPILTPQPIPPDDNMYVTFDLRASLDKALKVSLTWKAQTGNPTYRLLRTTDPAKPFELIGETKATTFEDVKVVAKMPYYYKIQAQYSATKIVEGIDVVLGSALDGSVSKPVDEAFDQLASATGGKRYDATSATVVPETIIKVIKENAGSGNVDIVLLIDNTSSMGDDLNEVKKGINKIIDALPPSTRLAAGGFRDHGDLYVLRYQDFSTDFSVIRTFINTMTASGGGDWPEAVYDAIYGTITQATWVNKKRMVIVVGDAPPQEGEKTEHSYEEVVAKCRQAGVNANLYPVLIKDPTNSTDQH